MYEVDLYKDYVCPKCGRCSELCNCNSNDEVQEGTEILEERCN